MKLEDGEEAAGHWVPGIHGQPARLKGTRKLQKGPLVSSLRVSSDFESLNP